MLDMMTPTASPWGAPPSGMPYSMGEVELDALLRESESIAARQRQDDPRRTEKVTRVSKLMREAKRDWRQKAILQETISTSDFSQVFDDLLNRRLLVAYQAAPSTWQDYVARGEPVSDTRPVLVYTWDGMNGRWYPTYQKPELTGLKFDNTFEINPKTYTPVVFERGFSYSWQTIMNDDLNMFTRMPQMVAEGGRRSVDYFATTLYADASGPHASVFSSGNGNLVNPTNIPAGLQSTVNPPLSALALADALRLLSSQLDPVTGEPIITTAAILVVPPALEWTARMILTDGGEFMSGGQGTAGPGTTTGFGLTGPNPLRGRVRIVVNPYLPIVTTSGTVGHTAWYLMQDPNVGRPAMEIRFLSGMEEPKLVRRASDMAPLSGGLPSSYLQGSFDTGEIQVKGVIGFGGVVLTEKSMVASFGTGS